MVGANRIRNLDAAVTRDGWRLVCLLGASPLIPFVAARYLLGLSAISLRDYRLGTLAALPALLGDVPLDAFARAALSASAGAAPSFQPALLAAGSRRRPWRVQHVGTLVAKIASGEPAPPG